MNVLITYGTRYGATKKIGEWMCECLPADAAISFISVLDVVSVTDYTHVILGSPLYDNDLLPEVKRFINTFGEDLANTNLGVYGVALSHLGRGIYGEEDGGLVYFNRFFKYLPAKPIYARLLGGALQPELLNQRDFKLIEDYYRSEGYDEVPREQEMDKDQAWAYVEKFLEFVRVKDRLRAKINGH